MLILLIFFYEFTKNAAFGCKKQKCNIINKNKNTIEQKTEFDL